MLWETCVVYTALDHAWQPLLSPDLVLQDVLISWDVEEKMGELNELQTLSAIRNARNK